MLDADLLRRLKELRPEGDFSGFNFLDFMHAEGSPFEALVYSRLFWPRFVEIDGMIFMAGSFEDEDDLSRLSQALATYGGDRLKTEKSFNLFTISSLFGRRIGETTDEEDGCLLERLAQMWHSRLRQVFPERCFVVEVLADQQTGEGPGIIFYQQAPDARVSGGTKR